MINSRCPFGLAVLLILLPACSSPARSFPPVPTPVRDVSPLPPATGPIAQSPADTTPSALPEAPKPVLTESDIREEALLVEPRRLPPSSSPQAELPAEVPLAGEALATAKALLKETTIEGKKQQSSREPAVEEGAPAKAKQPEPSLIAHITPQTPARSAASLRLAEEGRRLLEAKQYQEGLSKLEKAIALDSGNRYAYYYLAKAHYHLSHHQQSLNFLEIVELKLSEKPLWLARVYALEGENYRALGFFDRADRRYLKAFAIDPSYSVALEGLTYFPQEIIAPAR